MTNKKCYLELCKTENSISIFSQPFWLDAVCGESNWDVLLYRRDAEIIGALPYYVKKKLGISYITQPCFSQTGGVWIKYPEKLNHDKRLSIEKEVMTGLIDKLERLSHFYYQQTFHCSITNWLPFYWRGYQQTTRYTYRIEDISNVNKVLSAFSHAKRKNIKRAMSENLIIGFDLPASEFYSNHVKTLEKQNKTISYPFSLFERMYNAVYEKNAGCTIYAKDQSGNLHATLFIVWDACSAYDLISSIDPDFRRSGASTLLIIEIIRFLSGKVKAFDFEGSMIESVENSFRQFGAIQTPYFLISKICTSNPILRYAINNRRGY